jgi:Alpha/beta hydrolase family
MSLFCLVHGSTQSPAGWRLLVSELEKRGHVCICPDLPVNEPDASATRYAAVIGAALNKRAIVVAHSASGLFLPLVLEYAQVDRLIYLGTVLPQPGQSFVSQFNSAPEMYQPGFPGKDPTKDESLAREYLFHDCGEEDLPWALSTLRLMFAKQALIEETPLKEWPKVPVSYISCSEDRALNPEWWENAARERRQTEPIRIRAGHAPHVSLPADLAALLVHCCSGEFRARHGCDTRKTAP